MPVGGNCGYAISPNHKHPAYMFVIAYDSETTVYVGSQIYETSPNKMFCLAPNIEHHEVQNYLPPKYCAIFIDKELFENSFKLYTDDLFSSEALEVDINESKIDMLVKEFILESQNIDKSQNVILDSFSTLITHEIIRVILKYSFTPTYTTDNQTINKVIKFINTNYEKDITLDELAKVAKFSKSHFTNIFSKSMSISPMEYLKLVRLQNAKKMLLTNKISITKVSQQCGFNTPSYFSKSFKDVFKQTPKEYMKIVK